MKMFKRSQSVLILILSVMFFYACSSDSDNPIDPNNVTNSTATLTLNGSGYTNKSVTLSNGLAEYSVSDTVTAVQFSGKVDNDTLYMAIIFRGNNTGTFSWNDETGIILYKSTSTGYYTYLGISQGTSTVSTYGSVGNKVEGNVNGKLIEASSLAEINITGNFSAARISDLP